MRSGVGSWLLVAVVLATLALSGCSVKRIAANSVANALTSGQDVFASDNDPELVREALPFGLKTLESLLGIVPKNRDLLLGACRGFTQYGYAFVQGDADYIEAQDYERAKELRRRALNMYLRARDYGVRGLELTHPGIGKNLSLNPDAAAAKLVKKDVDLIYWVAASWGSAIGLGKDHPELMADINVVRALMNRGLALDPGFDGGSIHEAMIVIEAVPAMMGGSFERARAHFEQAVALSKGRRASTYVTMAENVSVQTQNRKEFEELLQKALAIDPDADPPNRLANLIVQKKARWLAARADEMFLDSPTDSSLDSPLPKDSKR